MLYRQLVIVLVLQKNKKCVITNLSPWIPLCCFLPQLLKDFWCHGHTNTFKDLFDLVRRTRLEEVFFINTSIGVDRWVHQTIGI